MPRNVRNFWLELSVDGSKSNVETGPRSKDGGFSLTILQRSEGGIVRALEVSGYATEDGRVLLSARTPGSDAPPLSFETKR